MIELKNDGKDNERLIKFYQDKSERYKDLYSETEQVLSLIIKMIETKYPEIQKEITQCFEIIEKRKQKRINFLKKMIK